jgi:SulP family sulfate permease
MSDSRLEPTVIPTKAPRRRIGSPQPSDVVAGISVALVVVPQSLAYAQLAGMPATSGLYAAAVPPVAAAPFASSPYLQPGPTAVSALLTFAALSPLAAPFSPHYLELGLLLALMVGVIRVAVGLARAGVLAYFISQPLLVGFVPAAAIVIVCSQLPVVLGVHPGGHNELYRAAVALLHPGEWSTSSILIAAFAAAILLLGRRVHPLFPGVLVAVAAAIAYSKVAGYEGATLGPLHAGLPPLTRSLPLHELPQLVIPAFVIALLGFAEATSIARTYAALERKRWDPNREFLAQGAANVAAGAFGGFPVGASFSRSALNHLAGARTTFSGLVTGLAVFAFIPLGFLLAPLPLSVLGVIVIIAVLPLIRIDQIVATVKVSRIQGTVTLTAFFLTLVLTPNVQWAIVAAIGLSIAIHLWRELRLDIAAEGIEATLHLRPQGVLWFGSARLLEDRFVDLLAARPDATRLVVHLDGLGRIDLTGALALKSLVENAQSAGLAVTVRGTPTHSRRIVMRTLTPVVAEDD